MAVTMLSSINKSKDSWQIKVRVLRMWEAINTKASNSLISLDMVLMDEEGTLMHGVIKKYQLAKFKSKIKVGKVYLLKNLEVMDCSPTYRPVFQNLKVQFLQITMVTEVPESENNIPKYKFEFQSYDDMKERANKVVYLTDVIGKIDGLSEVVNVPSRGQTLQKRTLEIRLPEKIQIKVVLWEDKASDPVLNSIKIDEGLYVVVLTGMMIKNFKGEYSIASTTSTQIYINLDIPETTHLFEIFGNERNKMNVLLEKSMPSIEEQMFENRKTIEELINTPWEEDMTFPITATIMAEIIGIENDSGWSYKACPSCWIKLERLENTYFCSKCDTATAYPRIRYKVSVVVKDSDYETSLSFFDRDVESLINVRASDLLKKYNNDDSGIPQEFDKIKGKRFIFQLKINEHNLKKGYAKYTVSKYFVPNDDLEKGDLHKRELAMKNAELVVETPLSKGVPSVVSTDSLDSVMDKGKQISMEDCEFSVGEEDCSSIFHCKGNRKIEEVKKRKLF